MNWFESAEKLLAKWKAGEKDSPAFYDNFTPRAKQVIALAFEQAKRLNHDCVGTQHILLGLISFNRGVAINVLVKLGVNLEQARLESEQIAVGTSNSNAPIPFTPRAKKSLRLAREEAKQLNHNHVGTEHLLLGILREDESPAAKVLKRFNLDIQQVRKEIENELNPFFPPDDNLEK
jgi:ATP-dependent Clp protease ATP-binding subunit ClpC